MVSGDLHEDLSRAEAVTGSSDRNFGLTVGTFCILVGGLHLWLDGATAAYWLGAGSALLVLALIVPQSLHVPNRLWIRLGLVLHRVVNPLIMGLLFFLVITPIGLVMRLAGRRPLRLAAEPKRASYWIERRPRGPEQGTMSRQF
jgi:hypothetical protein